MCCNNPYYSQQFNDIKNTWGKDIINGAYTDIELWGYTASELHEYKVDHDNHMLYVPCIDGFHGTFDKTSKAIKFLDIIGKTYDCILRTNCSTIINVPALYSFINSEFYDPTYVYVGELIYNNKWSMPTRHLPCFRGNLVLMNKHYANLINDTSVDILKTKTEYDNMLNIHEIGFVDDVTICGIFNLFALLNNINPVDQYKIFPIQYLENIYVNRTENIVPYTIAYMNKYFCGMDQVTDISKYFTEKQARLYDFYNNYYQYLNDDVNALNEYIMQSKYVSLYFDKDGQNIFIKIPFDDMRNIKNDPEGFYKHINDITA